MRQRTVLFVCIGNAGRSVMAEAFANALGGGRVRALSAGTAPEPHPHPEVVEAMREVGFDVSEHRGRRVDEAAIAPADVVVTMGCGDACPYVPGKRYEDWPLTDPAGLPLEEVRPIRDEIRRRVEDLLASLEVAPAV